MLTIAQDRADILARPQFLRFEDDITNKIGIAILKAQNAAAKDVYLKNRFTDDHYFNDNLTAGYALTGGVSWSTNGKLYKIVDANLPADMVAPQKIWVTNAANAIYPSQSSYSTDATVGDGLPDGVTTAYSLTEVRHEYYNGVGARILSLYVGTTAEGTTPKLMMIYVRELGTMSADAHKLDVPDALYLSDYQEALNKYLRLYCEVEV